MGKGRGASLEGGMGRGKGGNGIIYKQAGLRATDFHPPHELAGGSVRLASPGDFRLPRVSPVTLSLGISAWMSMSSALRVKASPILKPNAPVSNTIA